MASHNDPLDHPEVQLANLPAYAAGFVISLILMAAALLITTHHTFHFLGFIIAVSLLAVFALLSQAILMFRLDLSTTQIWKTVTLAMVIPLFILSIGLTGWMFHTLYPRTMLNYMQVQGKDM